MAINRTTTLFRYNSFIMYYYHRKLKVKSNRPLQTACIAEPIRQELQPIKIVQTTGKSTYINI